MNSREKSALTHRALAETSRIRILEELRPGPLDIAGLSARLGLHPNTIRSHLEILVEAGMVAGAPEKRSRPGRPRVLFSLTENAPATEDGGYRLLSQILATHLAGSSPDPSRSAREAGEAWGEYLADRPPPFARLSAEEATGRVVELFTEMGFAPEAAGEGGSRRILLHRCPFREAVDSNQEVVCSVHLGLLAGALREMGAPLEAVRLEPRVAPSLCIAHLEAVPEGAAQGS